MATNSRHGKSINDEINPNLTSISYVSINSAIKHRSRDTNGKDRHLKRVMYTPKISSY